MFVTIQLKNPSQRGRFFQVIADGCDMFTTLSFAPSSCKADAAAKQGHQERAVMGTGVRPE